MTITTRTITKQIHYWAPTKNITEQFMSCFSSGELDCISEVEVSPALYDQILIEGRDYFRRFGSYPAENYEDPTKALSICGITIRKGAK